MVVPSPIGRSSTNMSPCALVPACEIIYQIKNDISRRLYVS